MSVEYLVTGQENTKKQTSAELNELLHDIRHLSTEDLQIVRIVAHRLKEARV